MKVALILVVFLALITVSLVLAVDENDALRAASGGIGTGYRPPTSGGVSGSGFGQVLVNFFSLKWLFGDSSSRSGGTAPSEGSGIFGGSTSGSSGGSSGFSIFRFGGSGDGSSSGSSSGSGRFLQF